MNKKIYVKPQCMCSPVRTEQGICVESQDVTIKKEDVHVEVEEYKEISNNISFE